MYLNKFLKIKKSILPKAGKGVFTTIDIGEGSIITSLTGNLINLSQFNKLPDYKKMYCFYINKNNIIDSYSTRNQFGRYVNDVKGGTINNIENNAEFIVRKKDKHYQVLVVATCFISKGSEILVDYGDEYWF